MGTNDMIAVNDQSRPAVSCPLDRQYSLDPMGPRATLSLGDRNQPPSVGPVGRPELFERPVDRVTESDFKLTTQTRSESGSETMVTDSVIRTESEAQTVRANISMANGPTDLNAISSASDAVRANISIANGPMLTTQTRSESGSETVVTDSVIRTESDAQTVRANIGMANGPTDLNAVSSSSDEVRAKISIANGPTDLNAISSSSDEVRASISIANGPTDSNAISSSSDEVRASIGIANGPTDSNAISSSSDAVVHKLGGRLIQTEIVSESVAGRPVPVIQTKCEVQIDRSNCGIANGPTDPSESPPSSDSGIHSLGEQWEIESVHSISTGSTQKIKTFHSGAMNRDKDNPEGNRKVTSFVRTRYSKNDSIDYYTSDGQNSDIAAMSDFSDDEDDKVQTDRVNTGVADGPTDSSVATPSSDSGIHSLGEQWENMSANSMNTGSIQTVNTFNDSVVCQEDSKNQESHKLVFCSGTVCGEKDSMAYSTTDSQNNLDIAAMSDFSDDEDESQGELRPKIRTECFSENSIKKKSINSKRSDPNTNTVGVGSKIYY